MSTDDQALLNRWTTHNDPEAFRALVLRYSGLVYAACKRVLNDPTHAEDAAQECFEALAHAGGKPGPYLGAWLHRVATYHALNQRRHEARLKQREQTFATAQVTTHATTWDDVYAHVDEAINALPEKLRAPLVAYYLEQQTQGAVAETLGISRPLVNSRISKGVEQIRAALAKKGILAAAATLAMLLQAHAAEAAPVTLTARLAKLALAGPNTTAPFAARRALEQTLAVKLGTGRLPWLAAAVVLLTLVSVGAWQWQSTRPAPTTKVAMKNLVPSAPAAPAPTASASPTTSPAASEQMASTATDQAPVDEAIASISGTLRSADGKPLANYRVQACPLGGEDPYANEHATWSGDNGAFVLDGLKAGRYFVYTWESVKPSMIPFVRHTMIALFPTLTQDTVVTLAAAEQREGLELVLNEGPTIEGTVTDAAGVALEAGIHAQPSSTSKQQAQHPLAAEVPQEIPGSFAFNHNGETFHGKTDESGRFKIFGLGDADYIVYVAKEGYRQVNQTVHAGEKGLDIVMEKIGKTRIAGRVVDMETHRPIPAFEVGYSIYKDGIWGDLSDVLLHRNVTDESGRFVLELDGENGNGFLFAQARGYYRNVEPARPLTSGKITAPTELTIELPKSRNVRGRVVDEQDQPVASAKLFLGPSPSPNFSMYDKDAIGEARYDGTFDITVPAKHEIILSALLQEFEDKKQKYTGDSVSLPATDGDIDNVTIRLSRNGATVRGTVTYLGKPLRTRVDVNGNGGYAMWNGGSDENGAYEISQLPPIPKATVSILSTLSQGFGPYAPGGSVAYKFIGVYRELAIPSRSEVNVDLEFAGGDSRVQGLIQIDGQSQHVEGVSIQLTRPDGTQQSYVFDTDESGGFTAGGLPAGEGQLSLWAAAGHWGLQFSLASGQTVELPCDFSTDNTTPVEPQPGPY